MRQNAPSITAPPLARRSWWDLLRPDDPRYPRSALLRVLRQVGRVGWLPVTVYAGSAATNLVSAISTQGVGTAMRLDGLDGLARSLQLQGVLTLARRDPIAAAVILTVVGVLIVLIRLAQLDTRREAAVLRTREMLRLMQVRAAGMTSAATLRDALRRLELELDADAAEVERMAIRANPPLKQQLARLAAISEMLSRDLGAQAMWDELMSRQMTRWQRRQRLWSVGMGAASIVVGGVLPVLLGATGLGL